MKAISTTIILASALALLAAATATPPAFQMTSPDFADGGTIPHADSYDAGSCTGDDTSPELDWTGAPAGTVSFALTVFDPDARHGWWHWVVYGIDPKTHELSAADKSPGLQGDTSFGKPGYGGPCPPPGDSPHHYIFTLYALDTQIAGSLTGPQLLKAIDGHVIGKAVLVGRFGR